MSEEVDYKITQIIAGDLSALLPRLVQAVEKLGYKDVVSGQSDLYASREARKWIHPLKLNPLDYRIGLTIKLTPISEHSTFATFNYSIDENIRWIKKIWPGFQRIIEAEAEAISALTILRERIESCPRCRSNILSDARFCRRCGTHLRGEVAELEALRLKIETRAGYLSLISGAIPFFIYGLLFLGHLSKPSISVGAWLYLLFSISGLSLMSSGMWRLHRAVFPKREKDYVPLVDSTQEPPVLLSEPTSPLYNRASITDGTTELLRPQWEKREAVPIYRKGKDTAPTE